MPPKRKEETERDEFLIAGKPVFPLRESMEESHSDALEDSIDANWAAIYGKLDLTKSEIEVIERQKEGDTASQAAANLGIGKVRLKNAQKNIGRKRDRASLKGRRDEYSGFRVRSKLSLNPARRENIAGKKTWTLMHLDEQNFGEIMRAELLRPKLFIPKKVSPISGLYEGEKIMNAISIKEKVDAAVNGSDARKLYIEASAHLGKMCRDLQDRRDELEAALLEARRVGLNFHSDGKPDAVEVRARGFLQGNAQQTLSDLGPRVAELRLDIEGLERATELQLRVIDPLKANMISEISQALRPLHQEIARNISKSFREFSLACQVEFDLAHALQSHGLPMAGQLQHLALAGFCNPDDPHSKYAEWEGFVKRNGYSLSAPQSVDDRKRRPS